MRTCEIGMLAGHSTALFLALVKPKRHVVFDLRVAQNKIMGPAAEQYFRMSYPGVVEIHWGNSANTVHSFAEKSNASGQAKASECDFWSIDGSKSSPVCEADLYNMRALSHAGTILVFDDCTPTVVRKGGPGIAPAEELERIASSEYPKDLSSVLAYHLARREIILRECWDADIPGLESYGVCAISYNMSAPLTVPVDRLRGAREVQYRSGEAALYVQSKGRRYMKSRR
eukprot:Hpha_TRINITY_DN16932_c1_g10::TRINITY_DN16932_c1_g10_i1::g.51625::m.51625